VDSANRVLNSKRDFRIPGIVALVALIIRAVYFFQVKDNPFLSHPRLDALFHDQWALSIASGNLLGETVFFRAPLYPYFLGLLYAMFGHEYLVVRIIQHLFGVAATVVAYFLGKKLFSASSGFVAALLVAVYPMLFYFESQLLFESLLTFAIVCWLLLVFVARDGNKWRDWLLVGAALGIAGITRPPLLLVGAIVSSAAILACTKGTLKWHQALVFLTLGVIIVVGPITIRNYFVGGEFVPIASQGGVNFYIGNNPDADGISSSMPPRLGASWENRNESFYVEQRLGRRPSASEESAFWYSEGFKFITNEPISFFRLLIKKAYLFWNREEIPNNLNYDFFKKYSPLLEKNPIGFWLLGPFSLLGMLLSLRRGDPWSNNRLAVLFVGTYFMATIIFFVCDRYRAPITPVLAIFAASGIHATIHAARRKVVRPLIMIIVVLTVSFTVVNSNLYGINTHRPAREHFTLGIIALRDSRFDEAAREFRNAQTLEPAYPNLSLNLGMVEWLRGNEREAIEHFDNELSHNPRSFESLISLSQIFFDHRALDSSASYSLRAITAKPYLPAGYTWLARAHLLQTQLVLAESVLVMGSQSCDPHEFVYGEYLLGNILQAKGMTTDAESKYIRVLQLLDELSKRQQPLYEPEFDYSVDPKIGQDRKVVKAKTLYGLGHVLVSRGAIDSAANYFAYATTIDSTFADAFADLGVANLLLRQSDAAVASLRRAVELDSLNYLYWFNYGHALLALSNQREASAAFKKCVALNPKFAKRISLQIDSLARVQNTP
jgi:4-amino-4-deoxy-L-arabinose transferase-like glycosyltransferase/Flp pilus assembly protein TadD